MNVQLNTMISAGCGMETLWREHWRHVRSRRLAGKELIAARAKLDQELMLETVRVGQLTPREWRALFVYAQTNLWLFNIDVSALDGMLDELTDEKIATANEEPKPAERKEAA